MRWRRGPQEPSRACRQEGGAWPALTLASLLLHPRRAGHRPELLRELQRLRVAHSVRKLHVGDFVWVAQETRPKDPGKYMGRDRGRAPWVGVAHSGECPPLLAARPRELVLDHIVERKRLDDLCSSIIDGRFREQKVPAQACHSPAWALLLPCPLPVPVPQPSGLQGPIWDTSWWLPPARFQLHSLELLQAALPLAGAQQNWGSPGLAVQDTPGSDF